MRQGYRHKYEYIPIIHTQLNNQKAYRFPHQLSLLPSTDNTHSLIILIQDQDAFQKRHLPVSPAKNWRLAFERYASIQPVFRSSPHPLFYSLIRSAYADAAADGRARAFNFSANTNILKFSVKSDLITLISVNVEGLQCCVLKVLSDIVYCAV